MGLVKFPTFSDTGSDICVLGRKQRCIYEEKGHAQWLMNEVRHVGLGCSYPLSRATYGLKESFTCRTTSPLSSRHSSQWCALITRTSHMILPNACLPTMNWMSRTFHPTLTLVPSKIIWLVFPSLIAQLPCRWEVVNLTSKLICHLYCAGKAFHQQLSRAKSSVQSSGSTRGSGESLWHF